MCGRRRGAPVRRVQRPTNEYEYDGVWNEACVRELSVFPTTTGAPPHEFHAYINQQDGVLVLRPQLGRPAQDHAHSPEGPDETFQAKVALSQERNMGFHPRCTLACTRWSYGVTRQCEHDRGVCHPTRQLEATSPGSAPIKC